MDTITKYDALLGELEPYSPSNYAIKKALIDAGINDLDSEYAPDTDKRTIALAAIKILRNMIVLSSDSLGKLSQGYNVDNVKKRIKTICDENGFDASQYVQVSAIDDGSAMW